MRVSIPATAALAAFIHTAGADAKAVAELPTTAAQALIDEVAQIEAELQRQRDIYNNAQMTMCEQIRILAGIENALGAFAHENGAVSLFPGGFHFADSIVTFPPHTPTSNQAPEVIIQWPDLIELGEPGQVFITEGKNQHIVLQEQSLGEEPYYTKGFTSEAITEDISAPMQCFAEAVMKDGAWTNSVSCNDSLGQMSILTVNSTQAELAYFFDIATTPVMPMRLGCVWELDIPQPTPGAP